MRVTLLGTGCPVAHPRRAGPATLVEAGAARVLVDCGSMVTQRLVAAGCPGASLDALIVTHLHSDHLVDFYQLVVSSWHQGREEPWVVHCPETVAPVIEQTMAAWRDERAQRIAFEKRPSASGLEVETRLLKPGRTITLGGLEIEPVPVDHGPVRPAYGLVFRSAGKSAVISGDTVPSETLIAAGRGADLLVHEVFVHRDMLPVPGRRGPGTIEAVASYHTLSGAVGGVARAMGARLLALTHFVPPDFDRGALLAEVGRDYDGPVLIGEDLLSLDLAPGGEACEGGCEVTWGEFRARLP